LILLFGAVLVIGLLRPLWGPGYDSFFSELSSHQQRNLQRIDQHIHAIGPQWNEFTNQNPGFELVRLFAYTANDGVFAASGYVPSKAHLAKLTAFMEQTQPPRPVFIGNVLVVEEMPFEDFKKQLRPDPSGPANGSQLFRSETNRTSPAAGSRR
jgi:hypothetical protein